MAEPNGNSSGLGAGTDGDNGGGKGGSGDNGKGVEDSNSFALISSQFGRNTNQTYYHSNSYSSCKESNQTESTRRTKNLFGQGICVLADEDLCFHSDSPKEPLSCYKLCLVAFVAHGRNYLDGNL